MAAPVFEHFLMSMVGDVAVVELFTEEIYSPAIAQSLGQELSRVAAQEWARRLLVNFRNVKFLNSTGFAVLFKLVKQAKDDGRVVKMCEMAEPVLLGAQIVGLNQIADVHATEAEALAAFKKSPAVGA